MQLLEIQEPQTATSLKKGQGKRVPNSIAIGIDLGTTNSLVSYSEDGCPRVLKDELDENKIPSIVAVTKSGDFLVGNKTKFFFGDSTTKIISSIKRFMGKETDDFAPLTPVEISSKILSKLKNIAESNLKREVTKAVITVPAYFDESARQATKQAANLAGLEVLRIINEPTAAALAYGLNKNREGIYIIYDLGGGTFDVSILKMKRGVFQVIATGGDRELGGDDIDSALAEFILKKSQNLSCSDYIIKQACYVKERLSETSEVTIQDTSISISDLEKIAEPFISKTLSITLRTIKDSRLDLGQIDGIILVGGATKMPLVRQTIAKTFANIKIYDDVNPDEIVAMGAAIQAENLTAGSNSVLVDVTPLSLGIELLGGIVEKIITKNTPIPVSIAKEFTTYEDGQTGIQLHIVQGEREMARDCISLAKFELQGIPPMNAGSAKVQVTFTIDADGLLMVSAFEAQTKTMQTIEVMPSYGLSSTQVEVMLRSSIENAKQDIEQRLLTEAIVHAEQLVNAISKSIVEDRDLLSKEEYESIDVVIERVKNNILGKDRHSIDNAVIELEKAVSKFLDDKINKHINTALRGAAIQDIEGKLAS